ncbi:MAG: hypothetical protein R3B47_18900 [Bacteroidia bacterium]
MNNEPKILTLHPDGKQGVNILKRRYDYIRAFILQAIEEEGEISYMDLNSMAEKALADSFDGSVPWYIVTVKQDLEARGIIERVPKTSPHRLRMKAD